MTEDYHNWRDLPPLKEYVRQPGRSFRVLEADIRARLADPEQRRVTQGILGLAALGGLFFFYWIVILATMPPLGRLEEVSRAEASVVLTADGKELTRYYDVNRVWVDLDQISPNVVNALIATEDHRFYSHWGIDVQRTIGSIFHTLSGDTQGGSTITMQLVKNAFPSVTDDFVLSRKIKEWVTALRIESMYSKEDILEMYLNTVPMMYNAHGFEAAAQTYFQKEVKDLNLLESATLVGMLKGTVLYNPVKNPEESHERRNVVLTQMVKHGYLEEDEYERLKDESTELSFQRITHTENLAPYFAEHLRQTVSEWAEKRGVDLYTDGLRIHTTIDSRLQSAANQAVEKMTEELQVVADVEWSRRRPPLYGSNASAYRNVKAEPFSYFWESNPEVLETYIRQSEKYRTLADSLGEEQAFSKLADDPEFVDSVKTSQQRLQAAFIAIDPHTGHVKAWVGGSDFAEDKYDHVAAARRQPGSTFKPFVYAAAIEEGYSPYDVLVDEERTYVDRWTKKEWRPQNVNGATGKPVPLRDALAYSINTITAQLITSVGAQRVVDLAQKTGITSELEAVPSLGLGTSEVSLFELTNAYATLAANGTWREPIFLTRIEDREGNVLEAFETREREAISSRTAYTVIDMMRGVVDFGTGQRIRSVFGASGDLAGKTGTTQNGADGWFMLVHPNLVMGSWMGFNSPSISFRSPYWEQGAHTALYVIGNFIKQARLPAARFSPPSGYSVPPSTGKTILAESYTDEAGTDTLMIRKEYSEHYGESEGWPQEEEFEERPADEGQQDEEGTTDEEKDRKEDQKEERKEAKEEDKTTEQLNRESRLGNAGGPKEE